MVMLVYQRVCFYEFSFCWLKSNILVFKFHCFVVYRTAVLLMNAPTCPILTSQPTCLMLTSHHTGGEIYQKPNSICEKNNINQLSQYN